MHNGHDAGGILGIGPGLGSGDPHAGMTGQAVLRSGYPEMGGGGVDPAQAAVAGLGGGADVAHGAAAGMGGGAAHAHATAADAFTPLVHGTAHAAHAEGTVVEGSDAGEGRHGGSDAIGALGAEGVGARVGRSGGGVWCDCHLIMRLWGAMFEGQPQGA